MASTLRGHALPDMPTEAGGHGTRKSGFDDSRLDLIPPIRDGRSDRFR